MLNIVYGATESKAVSSSQRCISAFTGGALLVAGLAVRAIIVLPVVLQYVGLEGFVDWMVKVGVGRFFISSSSSLLPSSIDLGPIVSTLNGIGSPGAALLRPSFGLSFRFCFLGTPPISALITKRMDRLERLWVS